MRRWSLSAPCLLALFASSSPAMAQQQQEQPKAQSPSFELYAGAMIGPHVKIKSWDLHEESEQGFTAAPLWPQVGLRVGARLFSYVSLDAEVSYLTFAPQGDGARNHALAYRAGALGEIFPKRKLSPFVTAGVGAYHNVAGAHGMDLDMRTDYGFGARYVLSDALRARADLRHTLTDGIGDFQLGHNLEVLLSVEWRAWTPIADADDDGVADAKDACPMAAGPSATAGCPDTDADGLLDRDDRCPEAPGLEENRGCPDTDGDKLLDPDDSCPTEPGFIRFGGCPMPDTDGDGVPDDEDTCADVPEDIDQFQDEDGCPDLDNDEDRIADVDDKCPDQPETVNGVQDRDGCPENDQDGDGVVDEKDACPTDIETINEFEDFDGCPDSVPAEVTAMDGVLDGVAFTSDDPPALTPSAIKSLEPVVALMKAHPSVRYIITVQTGVEGDDQDNYFIAGKRADVLRQYLQGQGIKSEHLNATGVGEVEPTSSKQEKKNGRVTLERF